MKTNVEIIRTRSRYELMITCVCESVYVHMSVQIQLPASELN